MNSYMTMSEAYRGVLEDILINGKTVKPRGMETREIINHSFRLVNINYNFPQQATRKLSLPFMAAEFMWMISGSNDARLISPYNARIAEFSDDGLFFNGAYGPKLADQLPYVLRTLKADPDSRQALLTTWRERPGASKDIPCTILMQFFIREGFLDMVVYMRSNDAWLGLPYDVFNFTQIQKYVANLLGIPARFYHHNVGSMHLYENNIAAAIDLMGEDIKRIPPVSTSMNLVAPMPPEVLTVFTGISLLGKAVGVSPRDVQTWLDLSSVNAYPDWLELLQLCAYQFHKQADLLPDRYKEWVKYRRLHSAGS